MSIQRAINNQIERQKNQFIPEMIPIEKNFHQQMMDVKITVIKMLSNRGFIDSANIEKYTEKLLSEENDDMEFQIMLDNESNYNTTIESKKIYLKFFDYKISSTNKASDIGEFLASKDEHYKIIVVQDINSKSEKNIEAMNTPVEIFKFDKLQSDITEHILVPKHIVLSKTDGDRVKEAYRARNRDMPLIRTNDPVAKYFNMKAGEIVKIIRPSPITCENIGYRLVIKSKDNKVKT